jgi:anaerobic ribonucleoside-triphosphate reductase
MENKIEKVQKRDGSIVSFDQNRITEAIFKALTASGEGDGKKSKKLSNKVVQILNRRFKKGEIPHVEQIQDIVEEVLILEGLVKTAKAYILYREQRRRIREAIKVSEEAVDRLDQYIEKLDWEVQENANMAFSLQGLNHYGVSYIIKKYWLNKIYPPEIREAHESGDFHIHNLDTLGPYCVGWDLYDLLMKGFGGVPGKVESKPAKHFDTALMQCVNFLYTLQGEAAGAVSFSNFDTLLAPFIRYDNLNYQQVKQALQEFLFNMAIPTRVGFQTPFSNITLDLKPSPVYAKLPVIIGGKPQDKTYSEFEEEMKIFDKALYEVYMEGDAKGRPFHFPIPTINITKDFPWEEPAFDGIFEASAKYGTNYFANYINSEMKPEDVRSMCLEANEEILIRNSRKIKRLSIKEVAESYKDGEFDEEGWAECKKEGNLEALSLNPQTLKLEWIPVKRFLKIKDDKAVEVITEDGKRAIFSMKHPMAIYASNRIQMKFAKDIKIGEKILVTSSLQHLQKIGNSESKLKLKKVQPIPIKEVKLKKYKRLKEFYDIELERNHLFVHSLGQISFNCCRLRLDLTELYNRGGGGLFGSGSKTGCYDEKTQILTENGWKYLKDLTLEDRVFTLTKNNRIELHYLTRLFEYDYEGKMIHFKSRAFDLLVTPNHRMVVDHKYKGKRMFVEAKDFKPYQHYIPKGGVWEGEEKEWFVLPPIVILQSAGPQSKFSEEELQTIRQLKKEGKTIYQIAESFNCNPVTIFNICTKEKYGNRERVRIRYEAPPLKIKMDDWLKFFGFWLAEGSTDNEKIAIDHEYRVIISQKNKEKREEIKEVLNRLPFSYYEEKNNLVICNKQLWNYLRQFGNKYTKFIPKEIKNLSKRQLKILFDWMVKGNGHVRKTNGQINYWTASKKLADDLQEIILKLGWHATIKERKRKISQIKGRKVKTNVVYEIGVHRKTKHFTFTHKERIKNQIREVYYRGKVYCCEVPNHTVYVRRNGKATWCGNSIGVVTINLPRIGYLSKTKKEFFERLARVMDLAKESLEIKRKVLENFIEKGLYPYSRYYLQDIKQMRGKYWANHFSTIGLIGMNECLLNFMGENITSKRGRKFTLEVLDFMREKLVKYQEETGNIYNLEATPSESTAFRLSLKDKERYPDIITAGTKKVPFYTNSSQLPVNYTDDVFEALKLQDEIQCKYTGGTILHIFLGERMQSGEGVKRLVKKVFENFKLPYITVTPTFSICPVHGYIPGEHFFCPKCTIKQPCEVYSRIVGYYRPVQQWNLGKQQEFKQRKEFKIKESTLK